MGTLIDYWVLYDALKDISADTWNRKMGIFAKLFEWKMNDMREEEQS